MKVLPLLFSLFLFFPLTGSFFEVNSIFILDISNKIFFLPLLICLGSRWGKRKDPTLRARLKKLYPLAFGQDKEEKKISCTGNYTTSAIPTSPPLAKFFQQTIDKSKSITCKTLKIVERSYSFFAFFIKKNKFVTKDKSKILNDLFSKEYFFLFIALNFEEFPKNLNGSLFKKYYTLSSRKRASTFHSYANIIKRTADNLSIDSFTLLQGLDTAYTTTIGKYALLHIFPIEKDIIKNRSNKYSPLPIEIIKRASSFLISITIISSAILIAVIYKKIANDVDSDASKKLWNNRDKRECIRAAINRLVKKIARFPFWVVHQGLQYFGNHYPQVLGIEI